MLRLANLSRLSEAPAFPLKPVATPKHERSAENSPQPVFLHRCRGPLCWFKRCGVVIGNQILQRGGVSLSEVQDAGIAALRRESGESAAVPMPAIIFEAQRS